MDYKKYNQFKTYFFTSIANFNTLTDYEINEQSFLLFNDALTKAFPRTAQRYMYYNQFLKFNNSPSLIRALQHKFVNNFVRAKIPQETYFKSAKVKATSSKQLQKNQQQKESYLILNHI